VGADRKGPLVAFIIVAIVAAILLVTSVRSQAAEPDGVPQATVAETLSSASSVAT
jgi:hypothetical protein